VIQSRSWTNPSSAVQGEFVPTCMARPHVARQTSKTTNVRCCINVLGLKCGAVAPGQHGYPRASKTEL